MSSKGLISGVRPDRGDIKLRITAILVSIAALLAAEFVPAPDAAAQTSKGHARLPTASETIQEKLKPLQASTKAHEPVYISGRKLTFDRKLDLFTVQGDAKITEGATTVTADTITLHNRKQIHAWGNVHLSDPSSNVVAKEGTLDLTTQEATLFHAKVSALDRSYYLTGSKLWKSRGQNYHAQDANLTTCTCDSDRPDWSLDAKQMDLHVNGEMEASDGHFEVLGRPIMPLPYLRYNTDPERHSGLLSPLFGYSTLRGAYLLQPYFFDLGRNQDITTAADFESSARVGGLVEYRRADSDHDFLEFTSSYYNESIRSIANRQSDIVDPQIADPTIPTNRWGVVGLMEEHLTPDLFAYGTATASSDSLFFREMNAPVLSGLYGWNSGNWMTSRDAVSDLGLFQEFDNSYLRLGGVWNQDLIQPQRFALQTLPSLSWNGYQGLGNGLGYLSYNTSAVNYWRQEGVDGGRLDVNPQLTIPWLWSRYLNGWFATGFDAAAYDVSGHQVNVIPVGTQGRTYNNNLTLGPSEQSGVMGRIVPNVDLGLRTALLGHSDLSWLDLGKVTVLTVPTVEYDYVPMVNQNRFPLFDETDRVESRNVIFYGFSERIFSQTGSSNSNSNFAYNVVRGRVGPSFNTAGGYTEELLRLSVQEAYDTRSDYAPDGSHLSDIDFAATVFPNRVISGFTEVDWSPRSEYQLDAATFGFQFQPPGQKLPGIYTGRESIGSYAQLSYTYAAANAVLQHPSSSTNAISTAKLRAYIDVSSRLGVFFAPVYDLAASRLLTDVIGVRFKSPCDCWFADIGFNQTYNPYDTSVTLQVTLGGLGTIGQAPFGLNPFQIAGFLPRQPAELVRPPIDVGTSMP
jgi:lipopolysaccharide assembly outer membrane protein LptD (OstA)